MIRTFFAGFIMAIANVIPGVSGGTIAVVMGIYDRLVGLFALDIKAIKSDWKYLLNIGAGLAAGLLLFSRIITWLLENHPMPTCFFFIGLIFGSLPMLLKKVRTGEGKWPGLGGFALFAAALALMYLLSTLGEGAGMTAEKTLTAALAAKVFFSGVVAAAAMIVPGVSGSSMLLIFGTYATFYTAVGDLNIPLLVPIGLGVLIGLVLGSRAIRALMNKWPVNTYCAIIGLVLGSVFVVWPGFAFNIWGLVSVLTMAAGIAAAYYLGR